eukprot:707010-Hanusia_phi.AAC.1
MAGWLLEGVESWTYVRAPSCLRPKSGLGGLARAGTGKLQKEGQPGAGRLSPRRSWAGKGSPAARMSGEGEVERE